MVTTDLPETVESRQSAAAFQVTVEAWPEPPQTRSLLGRLVAAVSSDSLTRNSVGIMGTTAINAGLGYGYWTLAARLMPAAAVGLGSAVISAMVVLSLLVHLGAGAGLIARLPKRRRGQEWLVTFTSVQLVSMLVTLVAAAAAVLPLGEAVGPLHVLIASPGLACIFVLGAVFWTSSDLLDYVFIAERRSGLMLARNGVTSLVRVLGLIPLALTAPGRGPLDLAGTWALSGLLGTVAGLVLCHRRVHRLSWTGLSGARAELVALARSSMMHHLVSVGGLIPTYLLPMAVTARLGAQDNAYFYVTWMVGSAIFMISPAVSSALFAEGSHDASGLRRTSLTCLTRTLGVIVVPAAALCLIGRFVLHVFGAHYATAGYALLIVLILSSFPDTVTNVAIATMRVRDMLPGAVLLNGSMAVIAVAGTWFLAPRFGIIGAGYAWLGAQLVGALGVAACARYWLPTPVARHRRVHGLAIRRGRGGPE
jgi:O-antigen/teichoic acid export membrane protein